MISAAYLKNEEKIVFMLRGLYERYGYVPFRMSKFEEYDLYAGNKDFLVSDNVITFTDTDGRLMALKPDVTLSIVHNAKDIPGEIRKVYYDEHVYRVSKGNHAFKEILQAGLECIGDIDNYCIAETVMLAAKSLKSISEDSILDLCHLGIVTQLIDALEVSKETEKEIFRCISEKNVHELETICSEAGAAEGRIRKLTALLKLNGHPETVLPMLPALGINIGFVEELEALVKNLELNGLKEMIRIDFSIISDTNYYNGIVFRGFIEGVPTSVLSGGQYDKLMQRMGRKSRAIGFAVYLDQLERIGDNGRKFDVDLVLLYDDDAEPNMLQRAVKALIENGYGVLAVRKIPEKLRYMQAAKLVGNEVIAIEDNA